MMASTKVEAKPLPDDVLPTELQIYQHYLHLSVALEPSSATEVSQRTFSLCIKLKTASFQ